MSTQLNSKKEKQHNHKKADLTKLSLAFVIMAGIAAALVIMCALSDFASFLIFIPAVIAFLFVVLVPSVCTIFIIWASDGYRKFVADFGNWILQASEHTHEFLRVMFPYVAGIAGAIAIVAFVLNLIFLIKKKEVDGIKVKFVLSVIFLVLTIVAIILGCVFIYK